MSADSLLRAIEQESLAVIETTRVLGVNEWAIKKRESYGTILVDLEK